MHGGSNLGELGWPVKREKTQSDVAKRGTRE